MGASAAAIWQNQVYKKFSDKLGLHVEEQEEILLLKLEAEELRAIRKKLLTEKYD